MSKLIDYLLRIIFIACLLVYILVTLSTCDSKNVKGQPPQLEWKR